MLKNKKGKKADQNKKEQKICQKQGANFMKRT
jgi:hypothetical protein